MRLNYARIMTGSLITAIAFLTLYQSDAFSADKSLSIVSQGAKEHAKSSRQGIWKSAVPKGHVHSEFDAHDPVGLAAGAKIKTDCSINWVSPDTFRRYCFASGTSLVYFLRWPKRNAGRAALGWKQLNTLSH